MALAQHRIPLHGDTPYPHEREAIAFVEEQLPNQSPFLAWELVELLEASTGRLYEIDLLVLGYSALYLVEIKSGPGVYKGGSIDWSRDVPGEPPLWSAVSRSTVGFLGADNVFFVNFGLPAARPLEPPTRLGRRPNERHGSTAQRFSHWPCAAFIALAVSRCSSRRKFGSSPKGSDTTGDDDWT